MLDEKMRKIFRKRRVVGANVMLFDSERIVYRYNYGYANKARDVRSTDDSLYMIGSNTKVMTAVCILKLMEEGKLSLEDDIRKSIPEFRVKATFDWDKITIRDLLMHRSGLVGDLQHMMVDRDGDFRDVIGALEDTYLAAKPGTVCAYSNVGYTVLGVVIERVSGMTYEECVHKTIAEPLGIGIHFLRTEAQRSAFAETISLCYDSKGKPVDDPLCTMLPAGSNTYMSIRDFAKFGQIFLKKDGMVLKKETLELMETLECPEPEDQVLCNAGLGVMHHFYDFGEAVGKVYSHGGDTVYHHSVFFYIPEQDIGVVLLTNSQQGNGAAGEAANVAVHEWLMDKGVAPVRYSYDYRFVPGDPERCEGLYVTPLGVHEIRKDGKGGLMTKLMGIPVRLRYCEDGFWMIDPKGPLSLLPQVRHQFKVLRLRFSEYGGVKVLIKEARYVDNKNQMLIGRLYEQTRIPASFKAACGRYRLDNVRREDVSGECELKIEGDRLALVMDFMGGKGALYLKAAGDGLAFVQGIGRGTGNDVTLALADGARYLTWCGLRFRKVDGEGDRS